LAAGWLLAAAGWQLDVASCRLAPYGLAPTAWPLWLCLCFTFGVGSRSPLGSLWLGPMACPPWLGPLWLCPLWLAHLRTPMAWTLMSTYGLDPF
jgi:hypothetical protein